MTLQHETSSQHHKEKTLKIQRTYSSLPDILPLLCCRVPGNCSEGLECCPLESRHSPHQKVLLPFQSLTLLKVHGTEQSAVWTTMQAKINIHMSSVLNRYFTNSSCFEAQPSITVYMTLSREEELCYQ